MIVASAERLRLAEWRYQHSREPNFGFGSKAAIRASSTLTTAYGRIAELNQGQNQSAPIAASGQKPKLILSDQLCFGSALRSLLISPPGI